MNREKPIVDMLTLRRDLYFVMSLLLADKAVVKIKNMVDWTSDFHENEVGKLMIWATVVLRGLLDLLGENGYSKQHCGEYWADFENGEKTKLTFRQACNSTIHAKEILPYKAESKATMRPTYYYVDRITVRGKHKGKTTRAQIDIIKFVEITNDLINSFKEVTMPTNRTTYKYHFKKGNKIVHTGITNDIDRREIEHKNKRGWSKGHIKQVGFRTTYAAALEWEQQQEKDGKPTQGG